MNIELCFVFKDKDGTDVSLWTTSIFPNNVLDRFFTIFPESEVWETYELDSQSDIKEFLTELAAESLLVDDDYLENVELKIQDIRELLDSFESWSYEYKCEAFIREKK